jgi:hypothetical protein
MTCKDGAILSAVRSGGQRRRRVIQLINGGSQPKRRAVQTSSCLGRRWFDGDPKDGLRQQGGFQNGLRHMKRVQPFPGFDIELPDAVERQADERVTSYWVDDERVLLQLSSYVKPEGSPIRAQQRLRERIAKSSGQWKIWERSPLVACATEQAIAEAADSEGVVWIHAYFVWPHLTVYATISGPEGSEYPKLGIHGARQHETESPMTVV